MWIETDRQCPPHTTVLTLVAAAEVIDEHLFDGFVIGDQDVADGVAADDVADFFGQVFGVITGALEGLSHEDDLQTGLAGNVFWILDVAEENQVAEAVHLGVGAEDVDGFADVAAGEGDRRTSVSIFSRMVAIWVRSRVSSESMRPAAA